MVIGALIALVLLMTIGGNMMEDYAQCNRAGFKMQRQYDTMFTKLQDRYGLMPKYVSYLREYALEYKDDINGLIRSRNAVSDVKDWDSFVDCQYDMTDYLRKLLIKTENIEALQNNAGYQKVLEEVKEIQDSVEGSISKYNELVTEFNKTISKKGPFFRLIVKFNKYQKEDLFVRAADKPEEE